MDYRLLLEIYWILAAGLTVLIQIRQNRRVSLDGVIGNSPAFGTMFAVMGGGIYLPIYLLIKGAKYISKKS